MGGIDIEESDVRKLLEDEELIRDVIEAVVEDPDVMKYLVEGMSDILEDLIKDDPGIGKRIRETAMSGRDPERDGASDKLEKLEEIKNVGAKTAEKLRRGSYETVQQVAEASVADLKKLGISESVAGLIIDSAGKLVEERGVVPKKVPKEAKVQSEAMPIKQRILSAAMKDPDFRKKVVVCLVKET